MPYQVTTFTLPSGAPATHADGAGVITREDAEALMRQIGPGGTRFNRAVLVDTTKIVKMTSEARGIFSSFSEDESEPSWLAAVVNNPVLRVTINFFIRITRAKRSKMFSSEADAIAWLEERLREQGK